MRLSIQLLCLPTSLIVFLVSHPSPAHLAEDSRNQPRWPHNEAPQGKYGPEDSPHRRRELQRIQAHLDAGHEPVKVRMMTEDEGEMFFPEYWGFEVQPARSLRNLRAEFEEDDRRLTANSSAEICMRPSFSVHRFENEDLQDIEVKALGPRSASNSLQKKAFQCPLDTNACTGISQPNYCCPTGEVCVTATARGPVACCPSGANCAGPVAGCAPMNTECVSQGGGCCIQGFSCFDIGCISNVVVTMYSTLTQGSSPSSTMTTTTPTSTVTTVTTVTTATSSSQIVTASLPLKGTPVSVTTDAATVDTTPVAGGSCPTGFYACSAYYPGDGCCRIGRDCSTTTCPITASVTIVSSGLTIVVPLVPSATTLATASCAAGWTACPVAAGGNCCLAGYICGTDSSCTTSGAATATIAKETPAVGSVGTKADVKAGLVVLIAALGFAMMI